MKTAPSREIRGRPSTPFLRERILESASALFAEKDYDGVLIDDVAARAGVGKGSVYRQFKSKEELYAAVVIDGLKHLQAEIRGALKGSIPVRGQLATIVHHIVNYFWSRMQFFALLRDPKALPRRQAREYRAQREQLSRLVRGVLKDGIKRGSIRRDLDTRIATECLFGMLRGINRYSRDYATPEDAVRTAVSIFLDGCVQPAPAASQRQNS